MSAEQQALRHPEVLSEPAEKPDDAAASVEPAHQPGQQGRHPGRRVGEQDRDRVRAEQKRETA